MTNNIPTGRTYLGFAFLWGVLVTPAAAAFAFTMLLHGHKAAGSMLIVVTIYLLFVMPGRLDGVPDRVCVVAR